MITTTSQEIELAPTRLPGSQNAARLFVAQTLLQTNRLLTRWARDYITVIGAIVLPILFMVVLNIVLGNLAYVVTHDSGLYSIVPLIALGAAITGSTFVRST